MNDLAYTFPYDQHYRPALPMIEIGLRTLGADQDQRIANAIVDSGADVTLIPSAILSALGADFVGFTQVQEAHGRTRNLSAYHIGIRIGDHLFQFVRVLADNLGEEVILGRNVLNQLVVTLDGPGATTLIAI